MSSRALRKAQREREKQQQLENLHASTSDHDDESEGESGHFEPPTIKLNAFALLNQDGEDEEEEGGQVNNDEGEDDAGLDEREPSQPPSTASRNKKKKKKKNKASKKPTETSSPATGDNTPKKAPKTAALDEIDLALRSLSESDKSAISAPASEEDNKKLELLSIDTQHLNVNNEMRRLFGRAAVENASDENERNAAAGRRRRGRGGAQEMDLAELVAARNMRGVRNSGALGLRRNIFIQGKEEWPRATAGGLGMEVVEKSADGVVVYRFVHNTAYRDVQLQFEACVESMDPGRVLQLLQYNPYHISTLLQASEIAKQQRDHTIAGDLLERALFSFGRSLHSTFATRLKEGKARLEFSRPENRELWLAIWRYIGNLGMRGTWRTALEWAKLIFSLDPEGDPYGMRLMIDQLALRAKQADYLVKLVETNSIPDHLYLPNIQLSQGLALSQLGDAQRARIVLREAVQTHPGVFARLFQELNIDRLPPSIWGKTPSTPWETLVTELYAARAKDIWNTPEAIALLVEVAETGPLPTSSNTENKKADNANHEKLVDLPYARHALLTDDPKILAFIPREFTQDPGTVSDPLPPPNSDSFSNHSNNNPSSHITTSPFEPSSMTPAMRHNLVELESLFRSFFPLARGSHDDIHDDRLDGNGDGNGDGDGDGNARETALTPEQLVAFDRAVGDDVIEDADAEARLARLVQRMREIQGSIGDGDGAGEYDQEEEDREERED